MSLNKYEKNLRRLAERMARKTYRDYDNFSKDGKSTAINAFKGEAKMCLEEMAVTCWRTVEMAREAADKTIRVGNLGLLSANCFVYSDIVEIQQELGLVKPKKKKQRK